MWEQVYADQTCRLLRQGPKLQAEVVERRDRTGSPIFRDAKPEEVPSVLSAAVFHLLKQNEAVRNES